MRLKGRYQRLSWAIGQVADEHFHGEVKPVIESLFDALQEVRAKARPGENEEEEEQLPF